jgi:hypothetical protein
VSTLVPGWCGHSFLVLRRVLGAFGRGVGVRDRPWPTAQRPKVLDGDADERIVVTAERKSFVPGAELCGRSTG